VGKVPKAVGARPFTLPANSALLSAWWGDGAHADVRGPEDHSAALFSHLVILGPGLSVHARVSQTALLTLGIKLPAVGLQATSRRYPSSTVQAPILTMNIFIALLLNILHIHACNYSYIQFKAKTRASDESRVMQ
jgi:hypothetical protein